MPKVNCSYCGEVTSRPQKGYCGTCYARYRRNGTPVHVRPNNSFGITSCSFCGSDKKPFVKSLCMACYQRQYKHGSVEYTNERKFCEVPNCEEISKAHGLCAMHLKRFQRHGDVTKGRKEGWGSANSHPLYDRWKWFTRAYKRTGELDERWTDFWKFAEDVGDQPQPNCSLRRIDESKPYGPGNFEWKLKTLDAPALDRESRNAYMRAWMTKNPRRAHDKDLKKLYGISVEQFEEMASDQGHKCAICRKPEGAIDPYSKKPRKLAVDHCHSTGAVRSLLCTNCNTGLGRFNDDTDLLRAAIAYLEKHKAT